MTLTPHRPQKGRPVAVWIAIGFLAITLVRNGIGHFEWTRRVALAEMPFTWQYLVPIALLLFYASVLIQIVNRWKYGRWLAIITFGTMSVWEIYGLYNVLTFTPTANSQYFDQTGTTINIAIQLAIAVTLTVAFIVPNRVKEYFQPSIGLASFGSSTRDRGRSRRSGYPG